MLLCIVKKKPCRRGRTGCRVPHFRHLVISHLQSLSFKPDNNNRAQPASVPRAAAATVEFGSTAGDDTTGAPAETRGGERDSRHVTQPATRYHGRLATYAHRRQSEGESIVRHVPSAQQQAHQLRDAQPLSSHRPIQTAQPPPNFPQHGETVGTERYQPSSRPRLPSPSSPHPPSAPQQNDGGERTNRRHVLTDRPRASHYLISSGHSDLPIIHTPPPRRPPHGETRARPLPLHRATQLITDYVAGQLLPIGLAHHVAISY